ncbi:unnamed protein product, partial [Darwinula stevensoni]
MESIPELLGVDWQFLVTTGSSVGRVGNRPLVHLKLVLGKEDSEESRKYVHLELTVPEFYKLFAEFQKMKSTMDRKKEDMRSPLTLTKTCQRLRFSHVRCPFISGHIQRLNHSASLPLELRDLPPEQHLKFSEAICKAFSIKDFLNYMRIFPHFLSEEEESSLMSEIEPYMKRLRYEFDHWDDAIHGFRETERKQWKSENVKILEKVKKLAFPPSVSPLQYTHILDLAPEGYIKPHVDSIRFCGDTIAGLSLLSSSVMRLVREKNESESVDVFLPRRSLYIMTGPARYEFTHEILKHEKSAFGGEPVPRARRVSVICRNEPTSPQT